MTMQIGELVRIKVNSNNLGSPYAGQLAFVTGTNTYRDSYTVRYLSDGKEDWWFASTLERADADR